MSVIYVIEKILFEKGYWKKEEALEFMKKLDFFVLEKETTQEDINGVKNYCFSVVGKELSSKEVWMRKVNEICPDKCDKLEFLLKYEVLRNGEQAEYKEAENEYNDRINFYLHGDDEPLNLSNNI